MKLAVDARLMAFHPRGMGQYARGLVSPLGKQITALLPRGSEETRWPTVAGGYGFFPWWEQIELPGLAQREHATHLLCPANTAPMRVIPGVHKIVVVHDLIYLQPWSQLGRSPSLYQNLGRIYRRAVVPIAAQSADTLVTVSEFTRNELCERFEIQPSRVHVVPNSIEDHWFVQRPLADAERKRYLLTVSGEAPSKNVGRLLEAFARARKDGLANDLELRVAGINPKFRSVFQHKAQELGVGQQVHLEGALSGDELKQLYREAWAFILPSLFEGFGIPLLEAMASGTPVACSKSTSLPEVVGANACFFDPRDVKNMASAIVEISANSQTREAHAIAGINRAKRFRREFVGEQIKRFWSNFQ